MRVTQTLYGPPIFRYWKDFGEGKNLKKRFGYFNQWKYTWNAFVRRMKIADKTIPPEKLPAGALVMDAKDFLVGHIDMMPQQLLKIKSGHKEVYDHPWPYQASLDSMKRQEPIYSYTINNRFFLPKEDAQHLTNTIIETQLMEAHPPIEPQARDLDQIQRLMDWAHCKDSVLVRLPLRREFPKINLKPRRRFGITDERSESNVLKSIANHIQAILASHNFSDKEKFKHYLKLGVLSYPHCKVLFERESHKIGLNLCIDHMTIGHDPIPIINPSPQATEARELDDIKPRTWRSIIEKSRFYNDDDWSFKFPQGSFPRTIYLASRIKRDLPDEEMLSRNIIHAYGLARQIAAQKRVELPLALQVISYKLLPKKTFFFTRFQLNTLDFTCLKNQAWHSGPIEDINTALRYFLDFENIESRNSNGLLKAIGSKR